MAQYDVISLLNDWPHENEVVAYEFPLSEFTDLIVENKDSWQDKDDNYWLQRLMQEVGELSSVMANDHDDTIEHELAQIGSIAYNWLKKRNTSK